jgi:preprotein translocase subunit Sec63
MSKTPTCVLIALPELPVFGSLEIPLFWCYLCNKCMSVIICNWISVWWMSSSLWRYLWK